MTVYRLDLLLSQFWVSPLFHVWFCCFLTCTQVSQEAGKVVWYSHLFKNFPQFVMIHTVKGFSAVNEAELVVFLDCQFIIWWICVRNQKTEQLYSWAQLIFSTILHPEKLLVFETCIFICVYLAHLDSLNTGYHFIRIVKDEWEIKWQVVC